VVLPAADQLRIREIPEVAHVRVRRPRDGRQRLAAVVFYNIITVGLVNSEIIQMDKFENIRKITVWLRLSATN
jgi:hypothetical protein